MKEKKVKITLYMITLAMILLGLTNFISSSIPLLFYFGLFFFLCGFFAGNDGETFILFSHGMTGWIIMIVSSLSKVFKSPLMYDNAINLYIYLGVALIFFVVATALSVIRNKNNNFRNKSYSLLIPFVLYFIGLLMITIFPFIYKTIYTL